MRPPSLRPSVLPNRHRAAWALVLAATLLAGCGAVAVQMAPAKQPSATRSEAALKADALFWQTLHGGQYDAIPRAMTAMKAAYLQDPSDAVSAARTGWLHIWRLAESGRTSELSPQITDDAVLARRFFQEAASLNPAEARYQGFLGATLLAEGSIHHDEKLTRQGYFTLLAAIDAWPEFNLFTAGYTMSNQPAESERFKQALEWQWKTLDLCAGEPVDRSNPDFGRFMSLATTEGRKRVCWNSWIAPHNFEGFFLNMGDMLVKAGDWKTAQKIYANARHSPDFATWAYAPVLEQRVARAQANVAAFARPPQSRPEGGGTVAKMMFSTSFACTGCHQR